MTHRLNFYPQVLGLIILLAIALADSSRSDETTIAKAAAAACSGSQEIDFESTTGNAKYKDLKVEIDSGGKVLKLKNNGVLLAQITDFTFAKYQECLVAFAKALRELDKKSNLDLRWLDIGVTKSFVESKIGKPKFVTSRQILENDTTQPYTWKKLSVYNYDYGGAAIRVTYDANKSADSIFVGLAAEASAVTLNKPDSWPTRWKNSDTSPEEIAWSKLRFSDVGDETCEQYVHSSMSVALIAIVCSYSYMPPSGTTYSQRVCFISVGASDGAFGVNLSLDQPEITESEIEELREKKHYTDEQVQQWTWLQIKDKSFNYMMLSCEENLILTEW